MPIELYYYELSAPCLAVEMTAHYLNIDLSINRIDIMKKEQFKPQFLKLNPAHTVPVMVDGDITLWESRAIMQYLCNRYAPDNSLYPKDAKTRAVVDRWLYTDLKFYMANRSALAYQFLAHVIPAEAVVKKYKIELAIIDKLIADKCYLVGDNLTIADLSLMCSITMLSFNGYQDIDSYPNLKRWFELMQKDVPYYADMVINIDQKIKNYV